MKVKTQSRGQESYPEVGQAILRSGKQSRGRQESKMAKNHDFFDKFLPIFYLPGGWVSNPEVGQAILRSDTES